MGPQAQLFFWLGVVIAVFIVFWIAVAAGRRRLTDGGGPTPMPPLTLASAERMRDEGRLTDEEFQAVRAAIISAAARADDPGTAAARAQVESLRPKTLPRAPAGSAERRASPGYDLAGDPLPTTDPDDDPGENAARPEST